MRAPFDHDPSALSRRRAIQCGVLALVGCGRPVTEPSSDWGAAGLGRPRWLASAGEDLFFLDDSPGTRGGGAIFRLPHAGGLARGVVFESTGITGAAVWPEGIVWVPRRGGGALKLLEHRHPEASRVLTTGPAAWREALVTDGVDVFGSTVGGPLVAVPLAGGPSRNLFPEPATALALAPGVLVFVAGDTLRVVPRQGGSSAPLAPARGVGSLVVRGSYAYWAERSRPLGARTGALRRVALAGGPVETLVAGIADPEALAVGGARAWYAGAVFDPEARRGARVLGSVDLGSRSHREGSCPVGVTALLCEGASLYLVGTLGAKVGGVVRRQPA